MMESIRTVQGLLGRAAGVVRRKGIGAAARSGWRFADYLFRYSFHPHWIGVRRAQREFDRKYNVDTQKFFATDLLRMEPDANPGYEPIKEERFHRIVSSAPVADYSSFTFVDLGSGKGKALLLASAYPFRQVVGVEFSPELNQAAERNVQTFRSDWQRCRHLKAICADAGKYEFPDGDLMIYLYHPFGPEVLRPVLDNLAAAVRRDQQRRVYVIYVSAANVQLLTPIFDACPFLRRFRAEPHEVVYQLADPR
jgi:SAM-dependent methyltransferase